MTGYSSVVTAQQVAANRAEWLAALRADEYKQGYGALRTGDSYCCMGVAENLRDPNCWQVVDANNIDHVSLYATHFINDIVTTALGEDVLRIQLTELTAATRRRLGLVRPDPSVSVHRSLIPALRHESRTWFTCDLSELNDDHGLPFRVIADVIENQPPNWNGDQVVVDHETNRRVREAVPFRTSSDA